MKIDNRPTKKAKRPTHRKTARKNLIKCINKKWNYLKSYLSENFKNKTMHFLWDGGTVFDPL
jgi:hypothetical protein